MRCTIANGGFILGEAWLVIEHHADPNKVKRKRGNNFWPWPTEKH